MNFKKFIAGGIFLFAGIIVILIYMLYIQPVGEAEAMFNEAKIIFERNNKTSYNQSIDIFTKIIARYPESKYAVASYYFIGRAYEKTGLKQQAYIKYSYIIKTKSESIDKGIRTRILTRMAHLKALNNRPDEAITDLLFLLKSAEGRESKSRIYSELGHAYLKYNKLDRALNAFNQAIIEDGKNQEAILGKARVLKRLGKDSDTYSIYKSFLSNYGDVSQYTGDVKWAYRKQAYYSGLSSYRRGSYYAAIRYFQDVIKYFPKDKISENALYWTGECYFSLKKYNSAIKYFQRGLTNSFHHKDQDCRIKKGYTYFVMKNYKLAAKEFQIYIDHYRNGKYIEKARRWKEAASKELSAIYDLQTDNAGQSDVSQQNEVLTSDEFKPETEIDNSQYGSMNSEVKGSVYIVPENNKKIYLENVTEI